jgi:hypothetical protein
VSAGDLTALAARLDQYVEQGHMTGQDRDELAAVLEGTAGLITALRFYADPQNYDEDGNAGTWMFGFSVFKHDALAGGGGQVAIAALATLDGHLKGAAP